MEHHNIQQVAWHAQAGKMVYYKEWYCTKHAETVQQQCINSKCNVILL